MTLPRHKYETHDVLTPKGIVAVYDNRWFWCENGDPKKAVFYIGSGKAFSPQCNANKAIMERLPKPYEGCELIFIEQCFIPWRD